ncbi:hypothetical protein BJ741DRAFT_597915 [Chytriomyces cf. hyalinus JEL632]|nr:hypothetical protein BJ741DRAFT_597915 [Chytriomyces cf. hyalinus JEL632]
MTQPNIAPRLCIVVYAYCALVGINLIQGALVVKFIIWNETRKRKLPLTWTRVFTKFNLCLMIIPVANMLTYIGAGMALVTTNNQDKLIYTIVCDSGVALFELCYVYYTWFRGIPIMEAAAPNATPYLQRIVTFLPCLYILLPLPDIALLFVEDTSVLVPISKVVAGVCGLVTVSFDMMILTVFVKYLRKSPENGITKEDARLKLISWYGIVAACVGTLSLIVFSVGGAQDDEEVYQIYLMGSSGILTVVHGVLFAMKVALHHSKVCGNVVLPVSKTGNTSANASVNAGVTGEKTEAGSSRVHSYLSHC